jgi:transcription initiation factor IIE alpha subunit
MRTKDIIDKLKRNEELNNEERNFIINKWTTKNPVNSDKYDSFRCPSCNCVVAFKSIHYCYQCGQKLK